LKDYSLQLSMYLTGKRTCVCSWLKFRPFIGFFYLFVNRRLKGKELEGMSFPDLISLENQLNESLHSVKDQKVKTKY